MQRRLASILGVWIMACAALVAADFWTEKDFTSWSDKEVEKMLTDSPWSREVTIVLSVLERSGTGRIGGSGRDGLWDPSVAESAELASRAAGLPSAEITGVRRARVTVSWVRALPVKQALVRRQIGLNAAIPPEGQALLWRIEPYYVVAVSELPQSLGARSLSIPAVLAATALKRRNKEPISPDSVQFFRNDRDRSMQAVYLFPKTDAITLDDKDVEFVTTLSGIDIKKKFKLKEMVLGDQLVL